MGVQLDQIDRKILEMLMENARTPLSRISEEVGLSSPSIRSRIAKMERERVIQGYIPVLDYAKLGLPLKAYVNLRLSYPHCCTDEFIEALRGVEEVVEGHYTDGENDMVLMVVARDPGHLREVLQRLNSLPGVQGTKSTICLSTPIKRR